MVADAEIPTMIMWCVQLSTLRHGESQVWQIIHMEELNDQQLLPFVKYSKKDRT